MTTADGADLLDGTAEWSRDGGWRVPVVLADCPFRGLRRARWPGVVFDRAVVAAAFATGVVAGWPETASWRDAEGEG